MYRVKNMHSFTTTFAGAFHEHLSTNEGPSPLWDLLTVTAAHSGPEGKAILKETIRYDLPSLYLGLTYLQLGHSGGRQPQIHT